jgi:hypothetical protein
MGLKDKMQRRTANFDGSVSIVSLNPTTVIPISTGFSQLTGILYDGANIRVTDASANTLLRLNSNGSIAQTINVGSTPFTRSSMAQISGCLISARTH